MKVTKKSAYTGIERTLDLPVTQADLDRCWSQSAKGTEHVQDVFPHLSSNEREFLISGTTPEEWAELFPGENKEI